MYSYVFVYPEVVSDPDPICTYTYPVAFNETPLNTIVIDDADDEIPVVV